MSEKNNHQSPMQDRFLQILRDRIPAHLSMSDILADALDISNDSAYRRLRGEKVMVLEEIVTLSQLYGISLETLSTPAGTKNVTFSFQSLNEHDFTFEEYLKSQLAHFNTINRVVKKELIYAAKDLPAYYYYNIEPLAAFKLFVWKKSIMGLEEYEDKKFEFNVESPDLIDIGKQCLREYCKIPGSEMWNDESVNSTLRQIEVYVAKGQFKNHNDALILVDKFELLINHIEKQVLTGKKYILNEVVKESFAPYELYNNEVVLCDNSILVTIESEKMLFITHNTLNYLYINNKEYCELTHQWMKNLQMRSTPINAKSDKHRNKFFENIRFKIEQTRTKLS